MIIGKILAGTNLTIQSESADGLVNTTINHNGISIYNGNLSIYSTEQSDPVPEKVLYFDHDERLLTIQGRIISNAGSIGGWKIGPNVLQHKFYDSATNTTREICLHSYLGAQAVAFAVRSISGDYTDAITDDWDYHFSVRNNGQLNASNAVIDGTITATGGNIGGWKITKNSLDYTSNDVVKAFLSGTGSQSGVYTVGDSGARSDWTMWSGNFGVTNNGYLFATGANIAGTIKATSGDVGGLHIAAKKLYGITGSTGTMENNNYTAYVSGINSQYHNSSDNSIFLWAGAQVKNKTTAQIHMMFDSATWTDAKNAITGSASFYVTHTGELHATGVDISGTVKATSGKIGGWNLDSDGDLWAQIDPSNPYNSPVVCLHPELGLGWGVDGFGDMEYITWVDLFDFLRSNIG